MRPLPRSWVSHDYTVVDEWRDRILQELGLSQPPRIDAFASPGNQRCPVYWTREQDAFCQSWRPGDTDGWIWMNPPFEMLSEVLDKIQAERADVVLITPVWPHRRWYRLALRLAVRAFVLPRRAKVFANAAGRALKPRSWRTVAFLIHRGGGDDNDSPVRDVHLLGILDFIQTRLLTAEQRATLAVWLSSHRELPTDDAPLRLACSERPPDGGERDDGNGSGAGSPQCSGA